MCACSKVRCVVSTRVRNKIYLTLKPFIHYPTLTTYYGSHHVMIVKLLGIFYSHLSQGYHSHLFQNNERYFSKYLLMYAFYNIFYVYAVTFHCLLDVFVKYRQPQRVHAGKQSNILRWFFLFLLSKEVFQCRIFKFTK